MKGPGRSLWVKRWGGGGGGSSETQRYANVCSLTLLLDSVSSLLAFFCPAWFADSSISAAPLPYPLAHLAPVRTHPTQVYSYTYTVADLPCTCGSFRFGSTNEMPFRALKLM
jgi:hypothetical protein